jgi:recombination protein RecT
MADNLPTTKAPYVLVAESARDRFLALAPEKVWNQEIEYAMQILGNNSLLQTADKDSIRNAIVNVATTGTTLNPVMKLAYLVPRKIGGKMMCCLDFSYMGLTGIAIDSGSVKHIDAFLVYDFDKFEAEIMNGAVNYRHTPSISPPAGYLEYEKFWKHFQGGYGSALLADGTRILGAFMPKEKIEKAMKTSKTVSDTTPWRTHSDEQARKTILKHFTKTLPKTERLSYAVAALNEHEGIDTDKPESQASKLNQKFPGKKAEPQPGEPGGPPLDMPPNGPDDLPQEDADLFNELQSVLDKAYIKDTMEALAEAWDLVNKQKDNLTEKQYVALSELKRKYKEKIEMRLAEKKGSK